jgi:hypothetical protein
MVNIRYKNHCDQLGVKKMTKKLVVLILALGVAATAQASVNEYIAINRHPCPVPTAAPEIDPASAMSAFTLLAGGLVMIRGRRSSKSSSK